MWVRILTVCCQLVSHWTQWEKLVFYTCLCNWHPFLGSGSLSGWIQISIGWDPDLYRVGSGSLSGGIRISIGLDPDLFGQIRILEGKEVWQFAVGTFRLRIKLESELKQNQPDLSTLIAHLWIRYSIDRSFETVDFQME
jgi:hypothetical protein